MRNLVVPVAGDVAGGRTLPAVAAFLRGHGLVVSAFYASTVEMSLLRAGGAKALYRNLSGLPIDGQSVLIRSVSRLFGSGGRRTPGADAPVAAPGALDPRVDNQLQLDPLDDLLADAKRGEIRSYMDLLAREK
jgi:hypothetical protein